MAHLSLDSWRVPPEPTSLVSWFHATEVGCVLAELGPERSPATDEVVINLHAPGDESLHAEIERLRAILDRVRQELVELLDLQDQAADLSLEAVRAAVALAKTSLTSGATPSPDPAPPPTTTLLWWPPPRPAPRVVDHLPTGLAVVTPPPGSLAADARVDWGPSEIAMLRAAVENTAAHEDLWPSCDDALDLRTRDLAKLEMLDSSTGWGRQLAGRVWPFRSGRRAVEQ